jgi:hypothetical protein
MKKVFISILFLSLLNLEVFSQTKVLEIIEFGFSGGLAVPVGQFHAISVAPSLEPVPSGFGPERFQGFLKNEGGQAELGYSLGFHLTYHLTSSVFLSLNYLKI